MLIKNSIQCSLGTVHIAKMKVKETQSQVDK